MLDFRAFTEDIEVYSVTDIENDLGQNVTTYTLLGVYTASVDVASGQKALFYQERGYGYGVTIKMRYIPEKIGKIIWDGKTIYPRSIIRLNDKSTVRGNYLSIEGGFKND